MDNIFIEKGLATGQDLLACLRRLRPQLERQRAGGRPVRLLVVDSIAYLFRDMGDNAGVTELAGRTEMLFQISALLRWAAGGAGGDVALGRSNLKSLFRLAAGALALQAVRGRLQPGRGDDQPDRGLRD